MLLRERGHAGQGATSPDAILSAYQPQDLNPYAYASDNPATDEDPTGLRPTGPNNCGADENYCSSVTPDQPTLTFGYAWNLGVNVFGGTVNWAYNLTKTVLKIQAFATLGPLGVKAVDLLPSRIPIGDPSNRAYQFSLAVGPVFIPGVGEEDAAAEGLGVLDRIALGTRAAADETSGASWLSRVLAPEAVINEGVNSVSNIGAGAAARSADTIAGAEPGSAFSGVYDPASGRLASYPSVVDPAAPGAPVNAVRMYGTARSTVPCSAAPIQRWVSRRS